MPRKALITLAAAILSIILANTIGSMFVGISGASIGTAELQKSDDLKNKCRLGGCSRRSQ